MSLVSACVCVKIYKAKLASICDLSSNVFAGVRDVIIYNVGLNKLLPLVLSLLFLPILSIIGAIFIRENDFNIIFLFMFIIISILIIIIGSSKKNILLENLFPFIVFMISISLLYHSSLISNYITTQGSDVPVEYYISETTKNNEYWNTDYSKFWDIGYSRINAMLSVTILPAIYSILLDINITWIFKIIFPLIFSFVPMILYKIWQMYFDKKYAFFATFLFISQATFYTEMLGLNRQMIGEFFFILLIFTMLNNKIRPINKKILFFIFSISLVTSHYAMAELFLLFIIFLFVSITFLKTPSNNITFNMIIIFFVIMFSWYIYTSNSAVFNSILLSSNYIINQLGNFFDLSSRGITVMRGLGLEKAPSILNLISRLFAYIIQAFIIMGFIALITKRASIKPRKEYYFLTVTAMVFLGLIIIVPGLANTLNMTRFYHILLFFLSPLCMIGAAFIVKQMFTREEKFFVTLLLLIVLIPYFLFQTNFIYEVTGSTSWSIPLSKYRMNPMQLYGERGYIDEHSAYGARWLSTYIDKTQQGIYSDNPSRFYTLTIYGMIYRMNIQILYNTTIVRDDSLVYLSKLNTASEIISSSPPWEYSEFLSKFNNLNKVYASGASEVFNKIS